MTGVALRTREAAVWEMACQAAMRDFPSDCVESGAVSDVAVAGVSDAGDADDNEVDDVGNSGNELESISGAVFKAVEDLDETSCGVGGVDEDDDGAL